MSPKQSGSQSNESSISGATHGQGDSKDDSGHFSDKLSSAALEAGQRTGSAVSGSGSALTMASDSGSSMATAQPTAAPNTSAVNMSATTDMSMMGSDEPVSTVQSHSPTLPESKGPLDLNDGNLAMSRGVGLLCPYCGWVLKGEVEFSQHIQQCIGRAKSSISITQPPSQVSSSAPVRGVAVEPQECYICDKSFKSHRTLDNHMKKQHGLAAPPKTVQVKRRGRPKKGSTASAGVSGDGGDGSGGRGMSQDLLQKLKMEVNDEPVERNVTVGLFDANSYGDYKAEDDDQMEDDNHQQSTTVSHSLLPCPYCSVCFNGVESLRQHTRVCLKGLPFQSKKPPQVTKPDHTQHDNLVARRLQEEFDREEADNEASFNLAKKLQKQFESKSNADIQPRNNVAYSGVSISADMENNAGYPSYGVKRSAEEGEVEQESKKMVTVVAAMTPDGQQLYTNNLFEEITMSVNVETASVISSADQDIALDPVVPSSPTCSNPSVEDYPGHFMFDVIFPKQSTFNAKNKHWDYSHTLKKLFIDMNKLVQVCSKAF